MSFPFKDLEGESDVDPNQNLIILLTDGQGSRNADGLQVIIDKQSQGK